MHGYPFQRTRTKGYDMCVCATVFVIGVIGSLFRKRILETYPLRRSLRLLLLMNKMNFFCFSRLRIFSVASLVCT